MRKVAPRQQVAIVVAATASGLVLFGAMLYALQLQSVAARSFTVAVALLAMVGGWTMAALWIVASGSVTKADRARGVMRAVTGILGGAGLLFGVAGSNFWMWVSVVGASLAALLSFIPSAGQDIAQNNGKANSR